MQMRKVLTRKNLWEKAPSLLKCTLGTGLGILPVKWLLGTGFRTNCKFVDDAQWWPAKRAQEYQFNKLRDILKLAYESEEFNDEFDSWDLSGCILRGASIVENPAYEGRTPVIELRNIVKTFGSGKNKIMVLKHVNLKIYAKEFVVLFGPSGCGKSTLLYVMAGLEVPDEGHVHSSTGSISVSYG